MVVAGADWSGVNNNWRPIGGFFPSGAKVSVTTRNAGNLDAFVTGNNGDVYTEWWYAGSDWSGVNNNWRPIGGVFPAGAPLTAIAKSPNSLDLFIVGNNGVVYTEWWYAEPDTHLSADMQLLLDQHNAKRRIHCTPPLTWSTKVAADAQTKADTCPTSHNPQELKQLGEGENLYWGEGTGGTAQSAIDWWYAEIQNYNFDAPVLTDNPVVGHFTQMVWKASTQIGCGTKVCGNKTYWVCRFTPPGNWNAKEDPAIGITAAQARQSLLDNVLRRCQ